MLCWLNLMPSTSAAVSSRKSPLVQPIVARQLVDRLSEAEADLTTPLSELKVRSWRSHPVRHIAPQKIYDLSSVVIDSIRSKPWEKTLPLVCALRDFLQDLANSLEDSPENERAIRAVCESALLCAEEILEKNEECCHEFADSLMNVARATNDFASVARYLKHLRRCNRVASRDIAVIDYWKDSPDKGFNGQEIQQLLKSTVDDYFHSDELVRHVQSLSPDHWLRRLHQDTLDLGIRYIRLFSQLDYYRRVINDRKNLTPDHRKTAVYIRAEWDSNGFLRYHSKFSSLMKAGYRTLYYEVDDPQKLKDVMVESTKSAPANIVVIDTHGYIGSGNLALSQKKSLSAKGLTTLMQDIGAMIVEGGIVFLSGCCTATPVDGYPYGFAGAMSCIFPHAYVVAQKACGLAVDFEFGSQVSSNDFGHTMTVNTGFMFGNNAQYAVLQAGNPVPLPAFMRIM